MTIATPAADGATTAVAVDAKSALVEAVALVMFMIIVVSAATPAKLDGAMSPITARPSPIGKTGQPMSRTPADPTFQWIETDDALAELIATLRAQPIYGIDTEFQGERTYFPSLALIQVGWQGGNALIDPLAVDVTPFAEVFATDALCIVHAATHDLSVMERATGAIPQKIFDTQLAAGFLGMSTPSLSALCDQLLGLRLSKGDRLTDWRRRPLDSSQLIYAAHDVDHLLALHHELRTRLDEMGRYQWVLDECEEFRLRDRTTQDPLAAWWRIKECRSLKGAPRQVAQSVAAWRERWGIANDRPPRFVLPDLPIAVIASKPPRTIDDLALVRGVDAGQVRGVVGEEILKAIADGEAMSANELRLPPIGDTERESRPGLALVSAWIGQIARTEKLDVSLLATRSDVLALLRNDPSARLATGWRASIVGNVLGRITRGEVAVALDKSGDLVLVDRPNS